LLGKNSGLFAGMATPLQREFRESCFAEHQTLRELKGAELASPGHWRLFVSVKSAAWGSSWERSVVSESPAPGGGLKVFSQGLHGCWSRVH